MRDDELKDRASVLISHPRIHPSFPFVVVR